MARVPLSPHLREEGASKIGKRLLLFSIEKKTEVGKRRPSFYGSQASLHGLSSLIRALKETDGLERI